MVSSITGLVAVGMPTFIEMLMQKYGFRGCMAILAALNLHVLLGMIALLPVEWWNQKRVPKKIDTLLPIAETEELLGNPSDKKSLWYWYTNKICVKTMTKALFYFQYEDSRLFGFETSHQTHVCQYLLRNVACKFLRSHLFHHSTNLFTRTAI